MRRSAQRVLQVLDVPVILVQRIIDQSLVLQKHAHPQGHCLITLYEHTGDEKYLDIAKSKVEYLEKEALRFGDHVLQHTVSEHCGSRTPTCAIV